MIEIWAFDMGSGALLAIARSSFPAGLAPTAWQALKAFPESFGHYPRHGFPRLLSDGRREAMRFRVFDMESFHEQFLSVNTPSVLTAVQNRHKSSDPCCKRGLYVPGTGVLRLRSAAVS